MNAPAARIEAVRRICERFRIQTLLAHVIACRETLQTGGIVDVAVLGQFKAGKSSFLNSLIDRELVPVDVLPATAVVTRIGYGPSDRVILRHLSGQAEEIPVAKLPEYVTEQGNPRNEKQIAIVEVEVAALESYRGVRFVDTPGLGSIFAHNTQTSLDWLPKVGGALVAVSMNQPLGEQDLRLLTEVFKHTPEVAILLTKADLVPERQREVVVEFTQWHVAQHTGRHLPVLPFSIHPEYPSLRRHVRDHLLRQVVGRHEELYGKVLDHKLAALISGCREYLLFAQRAATAAEKARSDLRDVLRREQRDIVSVRNDVRVLAQDLKNRVRTASEERFHAHYPELTSRLRSALRKEMETWKGNLAKRTAVFQGWLGVALEAELARVSENGKSYLEEFLIEAQGSLHRTVRAFQDRLSKEIEKALGIAFKGALFHAKIEEPRSPDVRVGQTFDTHLELLWFAIPMGIFHPLFERHFLRLIPWEAEKNLSRLANQWAEATNASIESLTTQSVEFMKDELSTIETLVTSAGDQGSEIRNALRELDAMEGEECHGQPAP